LSASMDSARLLYNAHYYQLMGRPEIALKELQQAHEADPANTKVVDALAQMYQEQGQFQQAQELYQETLKRYGENRALHNNWCFSYYLQGDLGRAESCLQEALARDPGNMAARNNLGLIWCRQGKLAEAKRLWEEAEGAALAQTRMNQALAFLGMSAPAYYAKLAEPGPGAPLADSSVKSPAAAAPPAVKAAPRARPLAAVKAKVKGAPKAAGPGVALAQQPAASRQPPAAAPAIIASREGSLLVAEGQTSVKATPGAGLAESAQAPAPQKPAAPVLVAAQAGSLAAEPPLTARAAAPARPAAARPAAGLTEAAKVAPPPAPPVATSSEKSLAAQGKTMAAPAPARPLAATAKAKVKKTAKAAAPRTTLTAAEREKTGIEILNGAGIRNLAHLTRTLLSQDVFTVARIGNYIDFGAESTVIYYRPGTERVAGVLHSEIFPEAQLAESSKLRKGVAIKILLGRDLLEHPQIMARLRGEEGGASPQKPQPLPTASPRPAALLILAAAAASGAARSPLQGPPPTPAKTLVQPGVPLAAPTAGELIASVIEIRNGTRARMLAHQTRDRLSQQGFHVGTIGNHFDFGAETTVIYYRPGTEKVAQALDSQIFPGAPLVESYKLRKGVAIKILLGRDLLAQPQTMARLMGKGHEDH